jgi:hypothetical protein
MHRIALGLLAFVLGCSSTSERRTTNGSGNPQPGSAGGSVSVSDPPSSGCTPNPSCEPEPLPSSGDVYTDCVARINQFRVGCLCLPALDRWVGGEACANQHAEYDSTRSAHAGFSDDICGPQSFAQNECPGWPSQDQVIEGCLQMMWDEGPPPSASCEGQCFQDHGHFINMSNEDYSEVACGFFTTGEGEIWAVQNFR